MKRVANAEEQRRSGRSGVYYHLSYLGAPHDYLWLNTTPPVLMYEELKKAYDNGADRYWLLNVGDIKPMELGIQTFFDIAWDINSFSFERANSHQAEFLAKIFPHLSPLYSHPSSLTSYLLTLLNTYYRLAWSRKPEFMGWEYEWDDKEHTGLKDTEFSFTNYDEAQHRLADYQQISDQVEELSSRLQDSDPARIPEGNSSLFQLLQFPVQGAYQMNRKFLMAQLNHELLAHGRTAEANWAARQAQEAYDSINALVCLYNEQLDGKWQHFMDIPPGYCALYQNMPDVHYTEGAGETLVELTPQSFQLKQLLGIRSATAQSTDKGCYTLDLANYSSKSDKAQLARGLGYDWQVIQLGSTTAETVSYSLPPIAADSIDVLLYTLPFWPLYKGYSNRVGVSIDNSPIQVFENSFKEYDRSWKDQVMRNGAMCRLHFAIDKKQAVHSLTLHGIDPGQMVQRVVIDWGGLLPSYLGPQDCNYYTSR